MQNEIKNNVVHGTIVIFTVTIIAKIVAFLTSSILAYYLGTSEQSDVYYTVLSVDQVFYPMLGVGIWNVFLPLYKEKLVTESEEKIDSFANKSLTLFSIISLLVILVLVFFSDGIVQLLAPGFSSSTKALSSGLIRISAPMYFFTISAAIYAAMLQCHNNFLGSQLREVVVNIPIIIAAIFFYQYYGIESLAIALVIGGAFRLLVAIPFINWGYKYKPDFAFNDPDMKTLLKRFPSAMFSQGVNQLNMLVDRVMASSLTTGAVSALNYGNKLLSVLNGLLSNSITTALYPQVVELITLKQRDKLGKLLSRIINIFLFFMIPITVFCMLFSTEIVNVVYQRGAFNETSSKMTASVFMFYCIGLFFLACNTMFQNTFYAKGDTRTPLLFSTINLLSNIVLNATFVRLYGISGLALATSLSAIIAFAFLLIKIRSFIKLDIIDNVRTAILSGFISVLAAFGSRLTGTLINLNKYLSLIIFALVFMIIYLAISKIFKVSELDEMIQLLKTKLKR